MDHLHGVLYALATIPTWATVVTGLMITLGMLFILRYIFERVGYNTAWAAIPGDILLGGIVLIAIEILKRGAPPPPWTNDLAIQCLLGLLIFNGGFMFWFLRDRKAQRADAYHHIVIAPLFVFLLILAVPIIGTNGSALEITAGWAFATGWATLLGLDGITGRLEQRKWMAANGITLPPPR